MGAVTRTFADLSAARIAGFLDGMHGAPLRDVAPDLADEYAAGRENGTLRSGRIVPRPGLFDSAWCREVLARVIGSSQEETR